MPTDAELTFADHLGRFYARRYGFPPMVGRLVGYLSVCDPPAQTIGDLADALLASRSGITNAVKVLEAIRVVRRSRAAGERVDRVQIDLSSPHALGMDVTEYEEMRDVLREGLDVLRDAPPERQAVLLETIAFAEFFIEQLPKLEQEWEAHRDALITSGRLPGAARRFKKARS
jgi:DNA-binding transcriptional regulator GbsR (MarR family)